MQFRLVDYNEAHEYVDRTPNAYWEGWDIKYFTPNAGAFFSKDGVFDRESGKYGFIYTVRPNKNGVWRVKENGPNRRTRS